MTEMNNTGIVAVGKPTTSTPSTNDNSQTSAYNAYTNNFNYGYNYTTGQYDPAAYAQYYNAYNQYYGYNQQYQYDVTTGQYNYYPTSQTTSVQSQTSQNQVTTQTTVALSTPAATASTSSSVQQVSMIGPQLPPPPPPASTVSQTVTASPYTYSATQTTASSMTAVLPPPPPPPVPVSSSFPGVNIPSSMFPQQANMMIPTTVQPPIPSIQQYVSSAATHPPTNTSSLNTGMITSTMGSQPANPAVQTPQFTVPPPPITTTALPNYGYGYDYNYYNQQYNNTSMNMNTNTETSNQAAAPVAPINTNYVQQYTYSNQQQSNFQNFQTGQYNQVSNQQQSYTSGNMQYNQTNQSYSIPTSQSYSTPTNQFGGTNSYNWMDAYKVPVNDQKKLTTNTGNDLTGQKFVQQKSRQGNLNKKGKNKNTIQKNQDQSLKQQFGTTATEPEKPKEKLVLSKKVGPADASKPKGTFAALLGAVEFEPDEYDQSTESESEEEKPDEKTPASLLAKTSKKTFSSSVDNNKFANLQGVPKKQPKSFTTKPITPALANLEFDPEAFGLPTSFTGRLPKAHNTEPKDTEENKRLPVRESFRPKQSCYDWKPSTRNNFLPNKPSDEIDDASYEADFKDSYSGRSNWNNKDDSNTRYNSNHNNQNPISDSFHPGFEKNLPNLKQPPPLMNRNWEGNKQNVGTSYDNNAIVSQDPYPNESHDDYDWNDPDDGSYNHEYNDYSELSNDQNQTNFHRHSVHSWEKPNIQRGNQQFDSRHNEPIIDKPDFKKPSRLSEKPPFNQLFECEDRDDRFPVDKFQKNKPPFKSQMPPRNPFESGNFESKEYLKESEPQTSFVGTMNTLISKFLEKKSPDLSKPPPFLAQSTFQLHNQELDMASFGLPTSFAGKITSKNNREERNDDNQNRNDIQDEDFRYGSSSVSRWDDVQDTDWRNIQKNNNFRQDSSNERFSNENKNFNINSRNIDFVSNDPYFQHSEHFDTEDLNDYNEPDNTSRGQDDGFIGKRKSFEGKDSLVEDTKGKLDHWFGRDKTNENQPYKGRISDTLEPFKRMKPSEKPLFERKFESQPFKRHFLPSDAPYRKETNKHLERLYPLDNTEEPIKRFQSDRDVNDRNDCRIYPSNPSTETLKRPHFSDVSPFGKEPPSKFGRRHLPSDIESTDTTESGSFVRGPQRPSLFGADPPSVDLSIDPFKRDLQTPYHNKFKRELPSSDVTIEPLKRPADVTHDRFNKVTPAVTMEPFRKSKLSDDFVREPFRKSPSYKDVTIEPFRKVSMLSGVKNEPFQLIPASKDVIIKPLLKDSISSDVTIEPFMKKHFTTSKGNSLETPKENSLFKKDFTPKTEVPTGRKRMGFTDQPISRVPKHTNKPDIRSSSNPLVTKLVGTKGSKEISTVKNLTQEVKKDVNISPSKSENTLKNKSIVTRPPSPKSIIEKSETTSEPLSEPVKPCSYTPTPTTKNSSTVTNPKPNSTLAFLKSIMNRKACSSIPATTLTASVATTKPMDACGKPLDSKPLATDSLTTSSNSKEVTKLNGSKMVTSLSDSKKSILESKESNDVKPSKPGNIPAVSITKSDQVTASKPPKESDQFGAQEKSSGESIKTTNSNLKPQSTKPSSDHFKVPVSSSLTKQAESKSLDDNTTTKTSSSASSPMSMTSPKQANDKLACPQLSSAQTNTTTYINTHSTITKPPTPLYSKPVDHFGAKTTLQKSTPQTTIIGKEKIKDDPCEVEIQRIIDQVTIVDLKMKMLHTKCNLCNVALTSNAMALQHYKGKNHQKKLKGFQNELSPPQTVSSIAKAPAFTTQQQDANKYCAVCQMSFQTPSQASAHYTSKAHTTNIKQATLQKSKAVFRCELCNVTVYYQTELDAHLNGAKHNANSQKNSSPVGKAPESVSPVESITPIANKSAITKTSQIISESINISTECTSEAKFRSIDEEKCETKDVKLQISSPMGSTKVPIVETDKQEMAKSSKDNSTKPSTLVKQSVAAPTKDKCNLSFTETPEKKDEIKDSTSYSNGTSKESILDSSAKTEKDVKDLTSKPIDASPKSGIKDVSQTENVSSSTSMTSSPQRGRGGMERGRGGMERGRGGMERGRGGMERGRGGMDRGRGGRGRGGMDRGRGGIDRGRGGMDRGRGIGRDMGRFDYDFGGPFPRGPVHRGLGRRQGFDIDRDFGPRDDFHHHPEFTGPPPRRMRFM